MAASKQRTEKALIEAIDVKMPDGEVVRVPVSKQENQTANMLLAARLRKLLEEHIDKFRAMQDPLTPKELKDLTDSARNIAEFSADVYKSEDANLDKEPKSVEPVITEDFSKLAAP